MKQKKHIVSTLFTIVFLLWSGTLFAQFYNGHQMTFGKNRVQYNDFYWQYYRFQKFDIYFYVDGKELAQYVAKEVDNELEKIEYDLEEVLQHRIIFVIYNKQSEFKQSNVGLLSGSDDYNIGGVVRMIDNKVFLYYEGNHHKLKQQIRSSLAEILTQEMLYGGSFRSRLKTSTLLNLPEWFMPGLVSYLAYDLDAETESKIKRTMLNKKTQKMQQLHGEQAKFAGHAFWRYITEIYGKEIIANILYMTRITQSAETGFLYVLGMSLKDAINDGFYYNQSRYLDELKEREGVSGEAKKIRKKSKKNHVYKQAKISPNGKYIAYTTNIKGKYKVWIYDTEHKKNKKIVGREQKVEQITDYSYPVLAWHPNSKVLTYIYERKGHLWLEFYTIESKEKQKKELFYVEKVLNYSFSDDAQELVMSAIKKGNTDIFIYELSASTYRQITNDIADDLQPKFIENSEKIIFSSNRKSKQLKIKNNADPQLIGDNFNLFVYDKNKDSVLTQITHSAEANATNPIETTTNKYIFLSDKSGLNNQYQIEIDSTISHIDTSIHYRKVVESYPLTDNPFFINSYDYNPQKKLNSLFFQDEKRFNLLYFEQKPPLQRNISNTWFRDYYSRRTQEDSLLKIEIEKSKMPDTSFNYYYKNKINDTLIDINYYVFEVEKNKTKKELDTPFKEDLGKKGDLIKFPNQMVYFTNFYNNLMVAQVDFGFMNQSYQAYTGGAFYYNPGMNLYTKLGAIDLFEDYKITAGIRWSFNLTIDEFLLSIENLKKRLDKQYIYYRQVYQSPDSKFYTKVYSNTVMNVLKYPLTQTYGFRTTLSIRSDNYVYKSLDYNSLNKTNNLQIWGGAKGEFIFDNTRKPSINIYNGTRFKIFGEYYARINKNENAHLFVVGFDARNYLPIHRDLIFASRIAASSSFGNALLLYYLGGVDNQISFSKKTKTFDYSTPINTKKNWVYQATGTNLRGFIQNVRNGNSFAVINTEIRFPIIRYFFNRPINSDFLNHFMLIGFADAGSAWEGWNPLKSKNAYDYKPIHNGPVTVIIDKKTSPIIAGVGFGLRSRLLGYYIRADWAWGIDNGYILPRVFYLSLSTDF